MQLTTKTMTVNATKTKVVDSRQGSVFVRVHNYDAGSSKVICVGNRDLTFATGFRLSTAEFEIVLSPGQDLWSICDTGQSATVGILELDV